MNVVIYTRVSSKEQADGYSIAAQIKLCTAYCEQREYQIVQVFEEVESAKRAGRPLFNEMVRFVRQSARTVDGIVFHKVDRACRNFKDYVTIDELAEKHGIKLLFVEEEFPDTAAGKLTFGLKILLAKHFIDNLRSETLKGMTQKAETGWRPGLAPFGYRNVERSGERIVDLNSDEAPIVKELFEWYATGSYSVRELCRKFSDSGYRFRRSGTLHKAHAHRILNNRFYIGELHWSNKVYAGAHQAIISHRLFDQVQAVLNNHNRPRQQQHDFAWTGYLVCGHCGCAITAEIKKGRYTYYHCTQSKGKCPQPWIRERDLEERLGEWLKRIAISDAVLESIRDALHDLQGQKKELQAQEMERLQSRYQRLQGCLDKAYEDKLDGRISEAFWTRRSAAWYAELGKVREELAAFENANRSYTQEGLKILELAQRAHSIWLRANSVEKRKLLEFASSNSVLVDGSPSVTGRRPFDLLVKGPDSDDWGSSPDELRTELRAFLVSEEAEYMGRLAAKWVA